jgi:hypothetical protein
MTYKLDTTVNILGTTYLITAKTQEEDSYLHGLDGYTDYIDKRIVVADRMNEHKSDEVIARAVRHEVIHAFLHESGLAFNWRRKKKGHDETAIDWLAIQWPKINVVLGQIFATVKIEE